MRRPILAGNWKMHKTITEAIELVNGLKRQLYEVTEADIVVCPVSTALTEVSEVLTGSNIAVGAQNMFWEAEGAYTGEISAAMVKDAGCKYIIIGHSERRQYFKETNEDVNKKLKAALAAELLPIVCVGETLEQREKDETFDVIKAQVTEGLEGLGKEQMLSTVMAYEPVWAIGTGKTATPQQAQEVHAYIRGLLKDLFDDSLAQDIRIQYGGSIKPENIATLMAEEDIDGGLVGGASLKVESFSDIVRKAVGR